MRGRQTAWTLAGEEILLEGWHGSFGPGGPDRAGGLVEAATGRRAEQGDELIAWVAGEPVWGGWISRPPVVQRGRAELEAAGFRSRAERRFGGVLFQERGVAGWLPMYGPPWNLIGGGREAIRIENLENGILLRVEGETSVLNTQGAGPIFAAPRTPGGIRRVAFDWTSLNATGVVELRYVTGTYPASPGFVESGVTSLNTTSGSVDRTFAGGGDELLVQLTMTASFTMGAAGYWILLRNVRVNGIPVADTYTVSEVVTYLGSALGWNTALVQPSSLNVLPYNLTADTSWLDALAHMAFLQDWHVPRVMPTRAANGRVIEALEWGPYGSEVVPLALEGSLEPAIASLPLANGAVVTYDSVGGARDEVFVGPADIGASDPLAGKDAPDNYIRVSLPDQHPDRTVATAVGKGLLRRRITPQYEGSLTVADVGEEYTQWDLLPGRAARLTDFAPLEDHDLLIDTLQLAQGQPAQVGIRSPGEEMALVSLVGLERARELRSAGTTFDEAAFVDDLKRWRKEKSAFYGKGKKGDLRAFRKRMKSLKGHPKQRRRLRRERRKEEAELLAGEPTELSYIEPTLE